MLMALFLFLVCAVLAAVILAAGTAASGRIAGLADADQTYYSVSSAAELIRDMMGGEQGVSVDIVCEQETVTKREGGRTTSTEVHNPTCTIGGTPIADIGGLGNVGTLVQRLAHEVVLSGQDPTDTTDSATYAWNWQYGNTSINDAALPESFKKLELVYSANGLSPQARQVLESAKNVTVSLDDRGDAIFHFSSGIGSSEYALDLVCRLNVSTKTTSRNERDASTGDTTRTEVKTTTLTWKPSELKRVESGA